MIKLDDRRQQSCLRFHLAVAIEHLVKIQVCSVQKDSAIEFNPGMCYKSLSFITPCSNFDRRGISKLSKKMG